MKKLLSFVSVLSAVSMLVMFVACAKNDVPPGTAIGSMTSAADTTQSESVTPPPELDMSKLLEADGSDVKDTFKNPLINNSTIGGGNGNVGDPFVMRWNGKYYMYYTGTGVRCWTSDDLSKWEYVGTVADPAVTKTAYAPEVTYYNGYFYMYTSPAGNGHYVLRSKSPTGYFEAVTGNLGMSIDGSVFIDDDGKWYFYRADGSGIIAHEMTSPTTFKSGAVSTDPMENTWTEGPMVVKYNGVYFMTYCGNHFLSPGYRINYAYSTAKKPVRFKTPSSNPLLVGTTTVKGIGHNSLVLGPDLDSYYMVYHTMPETGGARDMRIDRVYFNGNEMQVMGPTRSKQQRSAMPTVYSDFTSLPQAGIWNLTSAAVTEKGLKLSSGGRVLTTGNFDGDFTAELNILSINKGKAGAVFGYKDENNYGTALFDPEAQELVVTFRVNGSVTENRVPLVKSFGENVSFDCLQLLSVEKKGNKYTFSVNSRELCSFESDLGGGSFGACANGGEAVLGYTALSEYVDQSSLRDYYKPFDGEFYAITCVEKDVSIAKINSVYALAASAGQYFNYRVNVESKWTYDFTVKYSSNTDSVIEIYQNKKLVGTMTLPSTEGRAKTAVLNNMSLDSGYSMLTVRILSGEVNLFGYSADRARDVTEIDASDFGSLRKIYSDGSWTVGKTMRLDAENSAGKIAFGNYDWNNYTVETVITPKNRAYGCGLIVRGSALANGGANDNPSLGKNFILGYVISIEKTSLKLYRLSYSKKEVASAKMSPSINTDYTLKVSAIGAKITVWLNGEQVIEYVDSEPFVQGAVGFCGSNTMFDIKSLKVYATDQRDEGK